MNFFPVFFTFLLIALMGIGTLVISQRATTVTCEDPFTSGVECQTCIFDEPFGHCPERSKGLNGTMMFMLSNRHQSVIFIEDILTRTPFDNETYKACTDVMIDVSGDEWHPGATSVEWDPLMLAEFSIHCGVPDGTRLSVDILYRLSGKSGLKAAHGVVTMR
jgi:hypothetical protein